jgi:Spy/CpxP family protein refolding chaperone
MKRFVTTITLATLAVAVFTLPLAAQDRPPIGIADRLDRHAFGLLRCLRGVDLSDSQKTDIKAILDAAKPALQADGQAIRAARQKLNADYDAGVSASVLGQDYLNVRTAVTKLQDDASAVKDQVLGKLTPDQKTAAQTCLDAHHGPGAMGRHFSE